MTGRESSPRHTANATRRKTSASQKGSRARGASASEARSARLIVGVGASAGGLQAFKTFFAGMPADSDMAFVLVQHLDPQHRSMLVELLSAATAMPVIEAADRMPVAPNHVYVIPPNATLRIAAAKLLVSKPAPAREHRHPVDTFFSALAEDQGENAVCIILSGGGSDGTEGLREIKDHGGLTMAQAAFDEHAMSGMPMSATASGFVDYVLAIEEMPAKLIAYSKHLLTVEPRKGPDGIREDAGEDLAKICSLLRSKLGHDFSHYKDKTLIRRIQRRMQVLQIDATAGYVERLRSEPQEIELLFRELLIGVTHFFRDPAAFEALQTLVVPHVIRNKGARDTVRIWVPACATGEEVYSIAMLFREAVRERDEGPRFQIFGTDIDERAIAVARAARYRKSQLSDMSIAQRERWFTEDGDHCCPVKEIRDMCIFSTHSVVKDPPFSKLDLISCRNLLIYLDSALQERLIRTFHYALLPGGYLLLGSSESVSRHRKLFATVDQKNRIFQRLDVPASLPGTSSAVGSEPQLALAHRSSMPTENGIERSARRLMEKYAPPYVVVDGNHDVLRFSGQIDKYLGPTPGAASLNLFNLIRRGLRAAARVALAKAMATRRPVTHEGLAIEVNGGREIVDLVVEPLADSNAGFCVVAFLDRKAEGAGSGPAEPGQTLPAEALEKELRATRERLEATIDQLETSNEEMKSANEEFQSVNEELQSTNEELETSKEEMQSINEELQTVNAELNSKNDTLLHLNSDLKNLLDSTQIATLFLDRQLRIKNFTPTMTDLFHLRDGDRGRPVTEIVSRFAYDGLRKDAARVMRDLSVVERLVKVPDSELSFLMRLRPYRTVDDVIDGVVITFVDISERARHEEKRATLAAILESSQDAIIAHSLEGAITGWNTGAERIFGFTTQEAIGKPLSFLIPENQSDEVPRIIQRLIRGERVEHFEATRIDKSGKRIAISMTISPVCDQSGVMIGASTVARDVSEGVRHHEERAKLAAIVESSDDAIISKDLNGIIASWNRGAEQIFGHTAEEVVGKSITILIPADRLHEEETILKRLRRGEHIDHFETVRQRKNGSLVEVSLTVSPIKDARGVAVGASKIARDITARKTAEALIDSQRQALELLAEGAELDAVLGFLVAVVERHSGQRMLGAITPLSKDGTYFERGVGASLPEAFHAAVEGVAADSPTGLCARAVMRREAVAVHDFNADPAWQPFGEFVAPYGLRSGWSVPIVSSNGQILGTYANYYRDTGDPTPQNHELVDMVLRTAAIAIERRRAEAALRESEQRLNDLITALPAAVYTTDAQGRITFYNQAAVDLAGRKPTVGSDEWCVSWKLYWPDGSPMRHDECPMAMTLKENRAIGGEVIVERPDGTRIPVVPYPTPLRDAEGKLVGSVNMLLDITERKQAELHQQMLINELNHRVKNMLAMVQAIASQTLRNASSTAEAKEVFEKRLIALSKAHDILTREKWQGANLAELVSEVMAWHSATDAGRFIVRGPDIRISPKTAVALAMALHELATNAVKYGSLSTRQGQVDIAWSIDGAPAEPRLALRWAESGGPTVIPPKRRGFGSRLIERGLAQDLGGATSIEFVETGVICTIDAPLDRLGDNNERQS